MSRDSLDEFAQRLWESAASERAPDELRARILARRGSTEPAHDERPRSEPRPRLRASWFWLAAAFGVVALALVVRRSARDDTPAIGAEIPTHNVRSARSAGTVTDARTVSPAMPLPRAVGSENPTPPRLAPPKSVNSARAPAASAERPPPNLAEELQMLQSARALIRAGNHGEALQALDAYAKDAKGSSLGSEASLLRIEALAGSGRRSEASSLARRFVEQNPNSPLVDRARSFYDQETPSP